MNKWKERLLKWDFKKIAVMYLVAVLIAVVAGGALMGTGVLPSRHGYAGMQIESSQPAMTAGQYAAADANESLRGYYGRSHGRYDGGDGYSRHDRGTAHGMYPSSHHRGGYMSPLHMTGLSGLQRAATVSFGAAGMILFFGFRILLALCIAQKAMKAGLHPVFWGIVTLVFHIYAVIVFFLYRGFQSRCPACGKVQKKDCQFCTACGAPLQSACPGCGKMNEVGIQYCAGCGQKKE